MVVVEEEEEEEKEEGCENSSSISDKGRRLVKEEIKDGSICLFC